MADPTVVIPVTVVEEPVPGSPEYDAKMIAKFDAQLPEDQREKPADPAAAKPAVVANSTNVKPAAVPDKFWDAVKGEVNFDAWNKSTNELETAFTKSKQTPAAVVPDAAKVALEAALTAANAKPDAKPEDIAAAQKALDEYKPVVPVEKPAPPDLDSLQDEFVKNGNKLTDDLYKKLDDAGYPKQMVDDYIAGRMALNDQRMSVGHAAAGGKELFSEMIEWAKVHLEEPAKVAFNAAVVGTEAEMKLAIDGLKSRFELANGKNPALLGGKPPANGAPAGYESRAQMTKDMRDPRYEKDVAFRKSVEAKVGATTAF